VKLAKYYVPGKIIAANRVPPVRGLRVDYLSVLQQKQPQLYHPPGRSIPSTVTQGGVMVSEVMPNSPAVRARMQENDVITHVNDVPVNSPGQFYQLVNDLNRKLGLSAPIELTVANPDWQRPVAKVKLE
jgi:S1-C subfamily serine protease